MQQPGPQPGYGPYDNMMGSYAPPGDSTASYGHYGSYSQQPMGGGYGGMVGWGSNGSGDPAGSAPAQAPQGICEALAEFVALSDRILNNGYNLPFSF